MINALPNRRLYSRYGLRALLMTVLVCMVSSAAQARRSEFRLLNDPNLTPAFAATRSRSSAPKGFPHARRSRAVNITPSVAEGKDVNLADTLVLNLFDDTAYSAVIDRVKTNINGTVMIRGRLKDYPFGTVLMSTTHGRSIISIDIPETGTHYRIQSEPESKSHYLLDLDSASLDKLEDAPSLVPDAAVDAAADELLDQPAAQGDIAVNSPLDAVTVDVMIVYTPAAASWADSSGGGIENVVAQAMQKAELALDNSETVLTTRLVYSGQVTYTESGSIDTDLTRLRSTTDGYMDDVHTLRNLYGVDLVTLYTEEFDYGGLGYLLSTLSGSPSYGFCVCRVQQVGWTYTMIHEFGHNMGCGHNKDQETQPGPGDLFSYAAGWRWTGNDSGKYCSVMSYEDGDNRVAYFSNPDVYHQGVPTGDAADGDNARTLRQTKEIVAAYRATVVAAPPTALIGTAQTYLDTPVAVTLSATDDGLPGSPGVLSYIITSLPVHGLLADPGAGVIESVPYTLAANGNQVIYTPTYACYAGDDSFHFKANDGGIAPDGGDSNEALVTITVLSESLLYEATMDTDPGWVFDSGADWAWGVPQGNEGDPSSGYTGSNVIGTNLAGDYPKKITSTLWATTPAIDCTNRTNVTLQFYRWLGVEDSSYDHAYVQVSNDGSNWTTLWENPDSTITDSEWSLQSFGISAVADDEPIVYVRWGMGTTDGSVQYGGWNIDDVRVTAPAGTPLAGDFEPDCDVDIDDLAVMIAYWLQTCGDCQGADLVEDEDNIVNLKDFEQFAQNWLAID